MSDKEFRIDVPVDGNKYRVLMDATGHLEVLRYGEKWWTVTEGSKCIISMACELEELRERVKQTAQVGVVTGDVEAGEHPGCGVLIRNFADPRHNGVYVLGPRVGTTMAKYVEELETVVAKLASSSGIFNPRTGQHEHVEIIAQCKERRGPR